MITVIFSFPFSPIQLSMSGIFNPHISPSLSVACWRTNNSFSCLFSLRILKRKKCILVVTLIHNIDLCHANYPYNGSTMIIKDLLHPLYCSPLSLKFFAPFKIDAMDSLLPVI